MNKLMLFGCFLFLCAVVFSIKAQSLEQVQGMQVATFTLKEGKKTLYLPAEIRGGDQISGVVLDEPTANNRGQLQKNTDFLKGFVIEIENTDNVQENGFLKTSIPISATVARLVLKDQKGRLVGNIPIPVDAVTPPLPEIIEPGLSAISVPEVTQAGRPFIIRGFFDGDIGTTRIGINKQPADILLEWPGGIAVQTPQDLGGPVEITLTEQNAVLTGRTHVINTNLSADALTLKRGQEVNITLTIDHVPQDGSSFPVKVSCSDNVALQGGNVQEVLVDPAAEGTSYIRYFTGTAVEVGGFTVSAVVVDPRGASILLIYPAKGDEVVSPVTFFWRSEGTAPGTSYTFRLWEGERPVFTEQGIVGKSFTLPEDVVQQMSGRSSLRWDVLPQLSRTVDVIGDGSFVISVEKEAGGLCNAEAHQRFINGPKKTQNENGFFVEWDEVCYLGTCFLKKGHDGNHQYAWKKCQQHKADKRKEGFKKKGERDARYQEVEKDRETRKAKHNFAG